MSEKQEHETIKRVSDEGIQQSPSNPSQNEAPTFERDPNRKWWHGIKEPGHALQIVTAAILAIAIGMAVTSTVGSKNIPEAATVILGIPGVLWLRALRAVVLPLIICAMILAVQKLREMSTGGGAVVAKWAVSYYVLTTLLAIVHSTIAVAVGWIRLMQIMDAESLEVTNKDDKDMIKERSETQIHDVVKQMFESFIPQNIVKSLADDGLLAILVTSVIVGYLLKPNSPLLKVVKEIEELITIVITWLIKAAPIGVFFLILPNLFKLDIASIAQNLGVLIGSSLVGMFLHLFMVLPLLFFLILRRNPYSYWMKNSPAWITAWGTASSAATLPVTMKCAKRTGIPDSLAKFTLPLGCLINMDGTAIYFPAVVVFLAATQGHELSGADYVIIVLLSTLASIGTTPIPSSSLVLTVMIATSVNVEITGMYAVVVAIDWFIDRFRTAVNVSGDLFAAPIIQKLAKVEDDGVVSEEEGVVITDNNDRV
ncbi:Sodium:dicarboxylate symporter [Apiosordaria backusii]|uniref:Amino acid transporter n=1 Tax=Apiosordaria backusii TaxID=314023 RepID=A0AA40AEJ0_9PEZI|nr:Sodium:dicarboxylate symporter [Apiosordaria backusii]